MNTTNTEMMSTTPNKKKPFTVEMDEEEGKKLAELASYMKRSRSSTIRILVDEAHFKMKKDVDEQVSRGGERDVQNID